MDVRSARPRVSTWFSASRPASSQGPASSPAVRRCFRMRFDHSVRVSSSAPAICCLLRAAPAAPRWSSRKAAPAVAALLHRRQLGGRWLLPRRRRLHVELRPSASRWRPARRPFRKQAIAFEVYLSLPGALSALRLTETARRGHSESGCSQKFSSIKGNAKKRYILQKEAIQSGGPPL